MSTRIELTHLSAGPCCDARLLVVAAADELLDDVIHLAQLPFTIGRSHDNRIVLAHRLVSRVHCELYEQDGRLLVRDLGSLNGTFVGNKRITDCELQPGDLLTVGVVTFRAVYGSYDAEKSLDGQGLEHDGAGVLDTIPIPQPTAEATLLHNQPTAAGNGKPKRAKP